MMQAGKNHLKKVIWAVGAAVGLFQSYRLMITAPWLQAQLQ